MQRRSEASRPCPGHAGPAVLIVLEHDVGTSWGVWSAATIAEEEDDGCVKHLGGRRSGHGADGDDEPDLCKVMAWGVNVSSKPCLVRGGVWRRVRECVARVCVSCVLLATMAGGP